MFNFKKNNLLLMFCLLLFVSLQKATVFAIDMSEFGDFSSRSTILRAIEGNKNEVDSELRELIKSKKLFLNSKCLIDQIKKGNYENVDLLLQAKLNPNSSYMSEYPVYIAAKENEFEILKLLVENGAKLDRGFFSELFEAVKHKNSKMALYLIDNGAKINYSDAITSNTILYYTLKNNLDDVLLKLVEKGVNVDKKSAILIRKKKLINLFEKD